MFRKRKSEDLSIEELEKMLLIKRRQARLERFERLSKAGYTPNQALNGMNTALDKLPASVLPPPTAGRPPKPHPAPQAADKPQPVRVEQSKPKKVMNMLLLGLEIMAVAGLLGVLLASYFNLRELNNEVSLAQQNVVAQQAVPTPTSPPPIALARLPGGHTPPTAPGGAMPDVPLHLQQWIQPTSSASNTMGSIEVAPDANPPTRIVIPKINVDAPIVNGVGWDDLKKGVGHLPGSANPGERGNLYLAAHNDIYGEIFRYLEDLAVGDTYYIYSGEEAFQYVVKERRIIDPTEVEVMLPTTEPVSTLQTCYPYLIDTHRLVIIGELAE